MDSAHLLDIHRRHGTVPLRTFPLVKALDYYVTLPYVRRVHTIRPLNYLPYEKEQAMGVLERELGWRYYGGKHYESRWTKFFQSYYLPERFGFDKRRAHLSSLILSGQMTRERALAQLQRPPFDAAEIAEDKLFVANKLAISVAELEHYIRMPIGNHADYAVGTGALDAVRRVARSVPGLTRFIKKALGV